MQEQTPTPDETAPTPPEPTAELRLSRLWRAADVRHIPLRTIVASVAVVAATYLAGKLIYRLRDVVLLVVVAGFVAILLNPIVVYLQKRVLPRRGLAVTVVALWTLVLFVGLAFAFEQMAQGRKPPRFLRVS